MSLRFSPGGPAPADSISFSPDPRKASQESVAGTVLLVLAITMILSWPHTLFLPGLGTGLLAVGVLRAAHLRHFAISDQRAMLREARGAFLVVFVFRLYRLLGRD